MNKEEKIFNYIEATWYDIHCKDKKEVRKVITMTKTNFLINNYDKKRMPYENRGKEYDKQRKRESRQKVLELITTELLFECQSYKKLQLTPYQELRVRFLVNHFSNDFKMLHGQAKTETIILAFIFYIKINEVGRARLNEYKITSKYGLTDNIFEIIVCRLCEYYMKRMPIMPIGTTDYDHDILSRNGGEI